MPKQTISRGGRLVHTHDLANPSLRLDLSADPWFLTDGQASILDGLDIREPNSLRADKGRRTVGAFIPEADQPVSAALPSTLAGHTLEKYSFVARDARMITATGSSALTDVTGADWTVSSPALTVTKVGAFVDGNYFAAEPGDIFYITNQDFTAPGNRFAEVVSRTDDTLVLSSAIWPSDTTVEGNVSRGPGYLTNGNSTAIQATKSFAEYEATGPWPDWMIGAFWQVNGDARQGAPTTISQIPPSVGLETKYQKNDTLPTVAWSGAVNSKVTILKSSVFHNKNGAWVTNGRKFWLLQDGKYTQYMDMGDDAYLGQRWSVAQISSSRFMFVCPKFPPRVLKLIAEPSTKVSDAESHAGLPAPISDPKDADYVGLGLAARGWKFLSPSGVAGGNCTRNANTWIRLRAVNLDENLESSFFWVGGDSPDVTLSDVITIFNDAGSAFVPPISPRATHVEVWRNILGGEEQAIEPPVANFHLEARMELVGRRPYGNENVDLIASEGANPTLGEHFQETPGNTTPNAAAGYPCSLVDANLVKLPALTESELTSGGLPPICRRIVSLLGVTICAGRADDNAEPVQTSHHMANLNIISDYTVATRTFADVYGPATIPGTPWYHPISGDNEYTGLPTYLNVLQGGRSPGGVPLGRYKIESTSDDNVVTEVTPSPNASTNCETSLEWPLLTEYPVIRTDEDIWYSRTDKFSPEAFPLRTLQVSRIGDIFRNMVVVGNYVAVIMANGVHLLYFEGTTLARDTIAATGFGTPWADSVVTIGSAVLWGTPNGPKIMAVSNQPDQSGHRAVIEDLDKNRGMRKWFREAYNKGYPIDAGVDLINEAIRWRRKIDANTYEVVQYYWGDDRWVSFKGDNGIAYVSAAQVGVNDADRVAMYSITEEGGAFEVNSDGIDEPYADIEPQVVTTDTWTVGETFIEKLNAFVPGMTGDVVLFRSTNSDTNNVSRVIRKATVHRIDFDAVPGLSVGDEIIIGGVHVKIRWAPLAGVSRRTVKTLEAVTVRLLSTGEENNAHIDMRVFEDFETTPATEKRNLQLHDPDDVTGTTVDSTVDLRGQGLDIEIELEAVGTKHAFRVEKILAEVTEEGDMVDDTSTET